MMVHVIRSPTFNRRSPESWVTPSPSSTIWPTISCPRIMGVGADLRPIHECTSDPQIVQQVTLTRMQPRSIADRGYSLISKFLPAAVITAAFAVLAIVYSSVSLQII